MAGSLTFKASGRTLGRGSLGGGWREPSSWLRCALFFPQMYLLSGITGSTKTTPNNQGRRDSEGTLASVSRFLNNEPQPSISPDELKEMQDRHREDIKVWKQLYNDVTVQLEQAKEKRCTDSQDYVIACWLQGQIDILSSCNDYPSDDIIEKHVTFESDKVDNKSGLDDCQGELY